MPIYEFYCPDCHTIFSFLSKKVGPAGRPSCPRCARPELEKQISLFSTTGNAQEDDGPDDLPISEDKMEHAMNLLAGEAENMNEDDPRQEARLMKKFSELTGIEYGEGMNEAIRRLEGGEDMEKIEAELGDVLEGEEEPFVMPGAKGGGRRTRRPPQRDETLYEL